jgi:signal transduction histidine kinase
MRMRTTLLLFFLSVSLGLTAASLVIVGAVLRQQIRNSIVSDLQHSVATFQNLQVQRRAMLRRQASLLADLPNLKSLMTADDERTIRDGGVAFWRLSGCDFFSLADRRGRVVALYNINPIRDQAGVIRQVAGAIDQADTPHYLSFDGKLFEVFSEPFYFGSEVSGTLLGYVTIGYWIDDRLASQVSQAAAATAALVVGNSVVASNLDEKYRGLLPGRIQQNAGASDAGRDVWLGTEHYLEASVSLSANGSPEVELLVLKSYDRAAAFLKRLNWLIAGLGTLGIILGSLLARYITGTITRPLETLVEGARALGSGNFDYQLASGGALELQELENAFDRMRRELSATQKELLEKERLATIGSMANSISHDMRHYLSAVYANAEFLSYSSSGVEERAGLMNEIRLGVQGMTEMIEALLIFSRTGQSLHPTFEPINVLVERVVSLIHAHPDGQHVSIGVEGLPVSEMWMDAKKIERAIYNLVLNACQAARRGSLLPKVQLLFEESDRELRTYVIDNGCGVADPIRRTLFEPFVSEGRQSGIGLGLTLANLIAQEHGGSVVLEESTPGKTIFCLRLDKGVLQSLKPDRKQQEPVVVADPD